jgi:hypothetical protein
MKAKITITSDPYLIIHENNITMVQDVTVDVYKSESARVPFVTIIKDSIQVVKGMSIGQAIMCFNHIPLLNDGILRLIKGDHYDEFMELVGKAKKAQYIE